MNGMGPIERELRAGSCTWHWVFGPDCSIEAYKILRDAARSLGHQNVDSAFAYGSLPDCFSEAIELASEFGL